jgi:hypothetical protein
MSNDNLIRMAESCSVVRRSIGRVLLAPESSPQRAEAEAQYQAALRELLRIARDEECALFLEAAGELSD